MNEWQPIETAPRDGEYVLLWCGFPLIGSSGIGKPQRGNHDWYEEQAGVNPIFGVTHWMPLPPPPQKETRRSGLRGSNTPEEATTGSTGVSV